jgi:hypothetical protein
MPNFIETAVILRLTDVTGNPLVVSNSNLENIKTNTEGFLHSFTHKGKGVKYVFLKRDYMSMDDFNEPQNYLRSGYYPEDTFLDYRLDSHDYSRDVTLGKLNKLKFNGFIPIETDVEIRLQRIKITYSQGEFLTYENFWLFDLPIVLTNLGRVSVQNSIPIADSQWNPPFYSLGDVFYANHIHYATDDLELSESDTKRRARAIILIAMKIDYIIDEVFSLLDPNDALIQLLIQEQKNFWSSQDIFVNPTTETILKYDDGMRSFYLQGSSDRLKIEDEDRMASLYRLMSILNWSAFSVLEFDLRIKLLKLLADSKLLEERFILLPIAFEHIVENLIKSFSAEDADKLLDALIEEKVSSGVTLFEYIFQEVNDSLSDKDALKHIMDHLCSLWLFSRYNYYMIDDETTFREDTVTNEIYSNSPIVFDYTTDKVAKVFTLTSHDFVFKGKSIWALKNNVIGVYTGEISTYGIYQGVSIRRSSETPDDIKLSFPIIQVNGVTSSLIPVFYLAYYDYNKMVDNIVATLELTLDVLLSLSGIGNLAKLRHLRHLRKLTRFGRAALGIETLGGEALLGYELTQGVAGVIEISASVANFYISYVLDYENTFCNDQSVEFDQEKCDWYNTFSNWLLVLQLKSGAVDATSSALLHRTAKKLLNGPIPSSFDYDAVFVLQRFAGTLTEKTVYFETRMLTALSQADSQLAVKFRALSTAQKREEFINDFYLADDKVLISLNASSADLVDYWKEINYLKSYRKNVDFLKGYRVVKNSTELDAEIFIGRCTKKLKKGKTPPGIYIDYEFSGKGVHHKLALYDSVLNPDGIANTVGLKQKIKTMKDRFGNTYSYYEIKVEVYHPDLLTNNGFKRKGDLSTFFPDEWTKQRVLEEVSLAYMNKTKKYGNLYKGNMSDGVECTFRINTQTNKIETAHPSI